MATLLEKNALASDPDFIARVKMALVNAAVRLPEEKYPSADQVELAVNVLAYPDAYAEGFAIAVATLPYITADSSDETIQYGVNSVFDAAAGSYEYVDPGGAVMPYPVAAVRGKNFNNQVAIPWYLSGGVAAANCIAAYQPKGAVDIAASYINLANPGTYNCSVITNAPTFNSATGWTFNGSDQYLYTGVVPNTGYSLIASFSGGGTSGNKCVAGSGGSDGGASSRLAVWSVIGGNHRYDYADNVANTAPYKEAGTLCVTSAKGYYNGSPDAVTGFTYTAGGGRAIYIGCINNGKAAPQYAPSNYWSGNVLAVAVYNTTLSDAQVLAISTAMAAL